MSGLSHIDRNRLAAFAFAGADVLFEVNPQGMITFCTGTTRALLRRDPDAFLGRPFEAFAASDDRFLARELLKRTTQTGRVASLVVHLAAADDSPVLFTVSAISLPEFFGLVHLACCRPHGALARTLAGPSVVGAAEFASHLAQAAESGDARGNPYEVTLIEVALERFRETATPEEYARYVGRLEAQLRASAATGTPLGRLDHGKYGVIRDAGCDPQNALLREVDELSREASSEIETYLATVSLKGGPKKADERATATRSLLGRFLRMGAKALGVASLDEAGKPLKEPVRSRQTGALAIHRVEQNEGGRQFVRQPQRKAS